MNASFKFIGAPAWSISENGIETKGKVFRFEEIESVKHILLPNISITNKVIVIRAKGKEYILAYPSKQKQAAESALQILLANYGSDEQRKAAFIARKEKEKEGLVFDLKGVRGRHMKVYEDRCVITTKVTLGSLLTSNATDGEKTIYYVDCVGIQFKESSNTIGYIQLETASGHMNNNQSNFFNENSFTFDLSVTTNEFMRDVAEYIRGQVSKAKNQGTQQVISQISAADELKKFKELLDMGVITQVEFDAKKKQLLGL